MGLRRFTTVAAVAAMIGTAFAVTSAGATPAVATTAPTVSRLAGTDRIGTAVAISQHVFPTPFGSGGSVYLARMDVFADAMAAGTLTDGPVLLVPSCAGVPQVVKDEVTRLSPARVVALGGTGAVCDQVLTEAAAGRQTARLAGVDRYLTSLEIARERAKQGPVTEVYVASGLDSPDAVVGGQLTRGPILLTGTVDRSADYKVFLDEVKPLRVVGLGGPGAVDDGVLFSIGGDSWRWHGGRLEGKDRYGSSAAIAMRQFPEDADTVYLARADVLADAVASGALKDGPVVLVGQCSLPTATRERIAAARPRQVIALGGPGAVCDSVLAEATASTSASGGRLSVGLVDSSGWPTGTIYSSKIAAGGRHLLVHGAGLDGAATTTLMVVDLTTGAKENVGILPDGKAANIGYDDFDISADGRFVVFSSQTRVGDTYGDADVFRRDLVEDRTDLISGDASRAWGPGDAWDPKVSDDGRTVAFTMQLGTGGYVWVSGPAATGRIDFKDGHYANDALFLLDLSADARYVLFRTRATNVVPGAGGAGWDVVRANVPDAPWGEMVKVNVKSVLSVDRMTGSLSSDGSIGAYSWPVDELAADDGSGDLRSFVHDFTAGTTSRIAGVRPSGLRAEDTMPVVSGDGRWVAFVTGGPPSPAPDPKLTYSVVQLADRTSGKSSWVSAPFDGSSQVGMAGVVSLTETGDRVSYPTDLEPLVTGSDTQRPPLVALWTRLSPR
jgi:hypothetical protein